jgi:hypothetical protein
MGRGRRRTANSEARLRKVVFDTQGRPWIPGVDTESTVRDWRQRHNLQEIKVQKVNMMKQRYTKVER